MQLPTVCFKIYLRRANTSLVPSASMRTRETGSLRKIVTCISQAPQSTTHRMACVVKSRTGVLFLIVRQTQCYVYVSLEIENIQDSLKTITMECKCKFLMNIQTMVCKQLTLIE